MTAVGARSRGVAAGTLRRVAFVVVLLAGVGVAVVDRAAGANAVFAGLFTVTVYGALVAVPVQVLYRDLRLRAPGVVLFAVTVLAIVAAFWCAPLAKDQFTDTPTYVVALHAVTGGAPLADDATGSWQTASLLAGLVVVLGVLALAVLTWRLQRHSRGRAVNPATTRSVLATFATLPEPAGGTSVTRPAPEPTVRRRR